MKIINTSNAPAAIGPYSQAIKANGFIFCSGQIPLIPETMELVEHDITKQTQQVLQNLDAVLQEAGSSKDNVVKTTIFLADFNDFGTVNELYGNYFGNHKPARATVEVSRLPKDVLIEVECVALEG
ncbi:2-iminobutanoate/2-iminopropanoate deaminase [Flavobacteriaceae bacterium UJ101]|nr:2-iminobutanoate/2-iminopropanoate deaminase [Flavobacteriaceae bacterium UJ101]